VHNVLLEQLPCSAARELVRSVPSAQALSDDQITVVVAACGGVPLLLKMLTDALACGRMTLADVQGAEGGGSSTEALERTVVLTILALPDVRLRDALAQLAVFPSGWEAEGAAAVMGCDEGRATALVRQLCIHGLALYDSSTGRHYLHMAVRTATATATAMAEGKASEQRFAIYMLGLMSEWARLLAGKAHALALRETHSHDADTAALMRMLSSPVLSPDVAAAAADAVTRPLCSLLNAAAFLTSTQSLAAWHNVAAVLATADERRQAAARLCCSWHLRAQGNYASAHSEGQAAMEACECTLGPEHQFTLDSVNNLAICLEGLGRFDEALLMHQRALEARERTLGPDHADTLASVNNLAVCQWTLGRQVEALPLYQRVLEACERTLGPEHPSTLGLGSNLALCLRALGRHGEALPLYQHALEARERTLGPEHHFTLASVFNLALCYRDLGRQGEALPLSQRALEARERTLGYEHPDTLASVVDLATCLEALGREGEAHPLYQRAMEARERTLGPEHHFTLESIIKSALCLGVLGRQGEALPLHQRAQEACQRTLGPEHHATLSSISFLALCLGALGRQDEALPLHQRVLEARERTLGHEHPDTLSSVGNLANCLEAQHKVDEAVALRSGGAAAGAASLQACRNV